MFVAAQHANFSRKVINGQQVWLPWQPAHLSLGGCEAPALDSLTPQSMRDLHTSPNILILHIFISGLFFFFFLSPDILFNFFFSFLSLYPFTSSHPISSSIPPSRLYFPPHPSDSRAAIPLSFPVLPSPRLFLSSFALCLGSICAALGKICRAPTTGRIGKKEDVENG